MFEQFDHKGLRFSIFGLPEQVVKVLSQGVTFVRLVVCLGKVIGSTSAPTFDGDMLK